MPLPIPTVTIVVNDNGASAATTVPQQNVQLKIGVAIGGTPLVPFATSSPQTLQSTLVGGPLVEAGGMVCQAGNIVVAVPVPVTTKGTATAVVATVPGGSTSAVTTTLDGTNGAWDTYYVQVKCLTGGTIGTQDAKQIQISLDAGRNWGPPILLGTANSYVIGAPYSPATAGGTGIQLNFGAGTLVAGDYWKFSTVGPLWSQANVAAAITAFGQSQYGVAGVGSAHVVGGGADGFGGCSGGDITAIQTDIQGLVSQFIFARVIVELRDASPPTAWGGSAESEITWINALATLSSGETAQPRVCADGGWYNTPSPYVNAAGGSPSYRRPLAWSHAVRRTTIGLQRRAGRIKDGAYSTIVVNPASDPFDGFIYHDERVNPGLNAARIGSAMTWPKKGQGLYQCQEPLLSANGSQFVELAIGNVLDAACDIVYAAGAEIVSDDLELQSNGTLDPITLTNLQGEINSDLSQGMVALNTPLVSSATAVVSASQNVATTGTVPIVISVLPKGYVNKVSEIVNLSTGA